MREKVSALQKILISDRLISLCLLSSGLNHHIRNAMFSINAFLNFWIPKMIKENNIDMAALGSNDFWSDFTPKVQKQSDKYDLFQRIEYVDNAKIYHANALKAACYAILIKLLHRPPGDPPPGGLVERFFGTTQSQFESEVRSGNILTLDNLNKAFCAYLEVVYHQRPHSETGQPPKERYEQGLNVTCLSGYHPKVAFLSRCV